jgi:hypothetical protein
MAAPKFRMMSAQESGIGGFLLLYVIVLFMNFVVTLLRIPVAFLSFGSSDFAFIGLVLIFRRERSTPAFFFAFLGAVIVLTLVDTYFTSKVGEAVHAYLTQHGHATDVFDSVRSRTRYQNFSALAWTTGWFLYWRSSERVPITFISFQS